MNPPVRGTDVRLEFWLVAYTSWITDAKLRRMQAAYSIGAAKCAADWGSPSPTISVASSAKDVPETGIPVAYKPSIDQAGDLAYHTLEDGRPCAVVLADPSQVSDEDVEQSGDHEVKETGGDPDVSIWLPFRSTKATEADASIAQENCDPVEDDVVPIDLGDGSKPVATSNWVTPAWFDRDAAPGSRLDALGKCEAPLVVRPGGYAVVVGDDGTLRQVGAGPARHKRDPAHRYGRRLATVHAVATKMRLAKLGGFSAKASDYF